MKKILLICGFVYLFVAIVQAQEKPIWDYPVKPGMEKWGALKTEAERFEAMQIPVELLKSMSTENLILICINYPAFGHYSAFNNILYGMNQTIKNFNGLQELLIRKDAPSKLLSVYSKLGISNPGIDNIETDYWWMRLSFFELLLAQKEVIESLNEEESMMLMKEAYKKTTQKTDSKEQNSLFNIQSNLLIIAKIFDKSNYSDFQKIKRENTEIEQFLNTGNLRDNLSVSILMGTANNHINSK